jgi:S-DNA-T family DNA segregation ATPase FtsK/SpoIIIE
MERRYEYFADNYAGTQNIQDYNKKIWKPAFERAKRKAETKGIDISEIEIPEKLPYIVIIFDEFNDFMLSYPKEITAAITSLTQKGRAAGIHLVLATQRPDVKVITGTIKANIPARIALKTSSSIDSRTILDQIGAEDLLGKGDMLYIDPNHPRPIRLQAPFVSSEEVARVIDYIKSEYYDYEPQSIDISKQKVETKIFGDSDNDYSSNTDTERGFNDEVEPIDDPEYIKAKNYVIETGRASTSSLQARFGWGYPKAQKFIIMLETHGIIGPLTGNKREVLAGTAQLEKQADELLGEDEE